MVFLSSFTYLIITLQNITQNEKSKDIFEKYILMAIKKIPYLSNFSTDRLRKLQKQK